MIRVCIASLLLVHGMTTLADTAHFGDGLCQDPHYKCITVKRGQNWQKLFPDADQRDIVQRVNRTNTALSRGKKIAVPRNLSQIDIFDVSPFPRQVNTDNEKLIIVDQDRLAWAAYDKEGSLVKWGPVSSGKDYCADEQRKCRSITGIYRIFEKKDKDCYSNIFPVERGGSPMPYCMYYYKGSALHGSFEVVGRRASHGCIRMFVEDARWLNEIFVDATDEEKGVQGTKVVIQNLTVPDESQDEN